MRKTDNYFIIDNFNTIPTQLLEYCDEYVIYDSSTDERIHTYFEESKENVNFIKRTGHNISSYFWFIEENYDNLPEVMNFVKGHLIGRHCSKEFFDKVYDNHYFTGLFSREGLKQVNVNMVDENFIVESNNHNMEFVEDRPQRYLMSKDQLFHVLYGDRAYCPDYFVFSPGGCYIVRKEQVLIHSKEFYHNVNLLMNYGVAADGKCPCEAHFIERILPIIFNSRLETTEEINSLVKFKLKLAELEENVKKTKQYNNHGLLGNIRKKYNIRMFNKL